MEDCLGQLLAMVKPSKNFVMRKLLTVKQQQRESIPAFVIRFRGVALESRVGENCLREVFLDALLAH